MFEFPLSLLVAAAFLLCVILAFDTRVSGCLASRSFSAAFIAAVSLLVAVEGTWAPGMYRSWYCVPVALILLLSLGFTSIADAERKSVRALLSHFGLFLVIFGGLFGSADVTDVMMQVSPDTEVHVGFDDKGAPVPLPLHISLREFRTDFYADGVSPKQYTSLISVNGNDLQTSVNRPCRYHGYSIYQSGFDDDGTSVLKVVRDPWIPVMALGAILLVIGAVWDLKHTWDSWKVLAVSIALAAVFTVLSVARINFGTLMPALRSLWFIPHLAVYMLAYAILALSVITAVVSYFPVRISPCFSRKLLSTASSLLLIGMLCGAVWAKQAWGDYWTWDPKECWAAATWALTLAAIHVRASRRTLVTALTVISFIAMQMTWYGVNYLPSSNSSLHTYNQQRTL